jgi:hypothetical protein
MKIELIVEHLRAREPMQYEVESLYCAGYTGRNRETLKKHIEELREMGVAAPDRVPTIYRLDKNLLTGKSEIEVQSTETSGEVEYVLLINEEGSLLVTVGSDHTDRALERVNVLESKQKCPKIISTTVWKYEDVKDHWDYIILRSYASKDNRRRLYQESTLRSIITPSELLKKIENAGPKSVIFSGTIPVTKGEMIYADAFEMEMEDPVLKRRLRHKYRVKVVRCSASVRKI